MNGVDTNVLVRYLTGDDPKQTAKARALMLQVRDDDDKLLVNGIVLCELVWVLRSAYGFDKATVLTTIEKLLATRQLEFPDRELVYRALDDFRSCSADFADCLIGRRNRDESCSVTWTFDRGTRSLPHFRLL